MDAKYVPIDDVAEYFSVSVSTIRTWVRQDRIPKNTYIKVGNTYRYCIPEILHALTFHCMEHHKSHKSIVRDEIPEKEEDKIVSYAADRREKALLAARTPEDVNQVINVNLLDEDQ